MSIAKRLILAGFMGTLATIYPQKVCAEGFRAKQFLEIPPEQQQYWLNGSIGTLVYIAAFKSASIGQCVNDWYFGDKRGERNWLILESMKKYPDYQPVVILVALTERSCGKHTETNTF